MFYHLGTTSINEINGNALKWYTSSELSDSVLSKAGNVPSSMARI
jgi:hypothetical protein